MLTGVVSLFALLSDVPAGYALLEWGTQTVELQARITDKEAVGHFKFKNTGSYPVKILTVSASCSCTAAVADKKTIGPGETGEITATLTPGRSEGLSQKVVTVITDDPSQKNVFLYLKVFIAPVLSLDPPYLVWAPEEALMPKTVHVSTGATYPVHEVNVTTSNPNVKATIERLASQREYTVTIVPKATAARIIALVKVQADYPTDRPKVYYVTVHVN